VAVVAAPNRITPAPELEGEFFPQAGLVVVRLHHDTKPTIDRL
jgi:hypothetical protein